MPGSVQQRAPRLGPRDRLAPHITRAGRFRKVDPLAPRKLPSVSRLLALAGWALLVEESLRRAYRSVQADHAPDPAPAAEGAGSARG